MNCNALTDSFVVPSNACKYVSICSAAMLPVQRSVGVTPKVNLRSPSQHTREATMPWKLRHHQSSITLDTQTQFVLIKKIGNDSFTSWLVGHKGVEGAKAP